MTSPRIIASIEARMSSSRLPGKMMLDIGGIPVLGLLIERLRLVSRITDIVVATSNNPADDPLAEYAARINAAVFRGDETDVLNRVVAAQAHMASDIVVEICGDCPLIDPDVVDAAISRFLDGTADVVTTTQPQSYPQGMDVQVFSLSDLKWVEENITDPAVREHVSLYFYEHPDRYQIVSLAAPSGQARPDLRLQLDYAEDFALIQAVYGNLSGKQGNRFKLDEILAFLDANPEIARINAHCEERAVR
ncbi:glycosyltransferase family protein [Ferrovibrio sp.]|uniref:glycosyltransferase family protein n=1 Tax=Ferrovibrio sp. TaxID=1917215 RepID=UPI002619AE27|nr:glycosyltransferase family protein [Ferrovibrio sp.]